MLRMYYGLQGGGKTYSMFSDCLDKFRECPVQVYTNIASAKIPEAIYFHSVEELCNISNGLVLLDEVGIVMPAQFWHSMGRDLLTRLCQMRKNGLDLWYTTQRREGANVNLREQTGDFQCCNRFMRWIWRRGDNGDEKRKTGGSKFIKLRPEVFGIYDTFNVIEASGGSGERRQQTDLSLAVRRRAARAREREAAAAARKRPQSLLRYDPFEQGWFGGCYLLRPTPEAQTVLTWLKDRGHYLEAVHWATQVRAEIERREWLRLFHLSPDDAPITCRPESPWLDGYDPKSVIKRYEKAQEEIEIEKMAIRTVNNKRRKEAA